MGTRSPSGSKRKREDSSTPGLPTKNAQNKWITPSFDGTSPDKKKSKPMMKVSALDAPSFKMKDIAPTTPKPMNVASPSSIARGPRFPAFKPPEAASAITGPDTADTPNRGAALSSLQHRFGPPRQSNPSTPIKKEVKPLLPPAFPFTSSSSKPASLGPAFSKPLNQTPLTTRLAAITAPVASSSSSDGHPSSDDAHAQARVSIAAQARELMAKAEEQDLLSGVKDEMDEMFVGLTVSPEKSDRMGKRRGFVRNGLAERASHLINRAQNDFSLWSHDLASSLSNAQDIRAYANSRQNKAVKPIPPDLRIMISETLTSFHTKDFSRPSRMVVPPSYCLARCKIKGTDVEDLLVLFSFATTSGHGFAVPSISSPKGLEVGAEVLVWKPWIEVDLDQHIASETVNEPEDLDEEIKLIPRLGTPERAESGDVQVEDIDTQPTTPTNENDRQMVKAKMLSLLEEKGETSARRRAMLCSRFMVKR
ncbi:hypothetical protein FRC01_005278 [Tulasnella sp. 417]|nr:hypothetical protein FRC01_005278 [Tulasnella sp. 417]